MMRWVRPTIWHRSFRYPIRTTGTPTARYRYLRSQSRDGAAVRGQRAELGRRNDASGVVHWHTPKKWLEEHQKPRPTSAERWQPFTLPQLAGLLPPGVRGAPSERLADVTDQIATDRAADRLWPASGFPETSSRRKDTARSASTQITQTAQGYINSCRNHKSYDNRGY